MQGPNEAEKTIVNSLSVVAVLIANVAYIGYITPPGGFKPFWETCNYIAFVAFIYLNGLAFLFSVCAVCVMVFMPWLLQEVPDWHKTIIRWGIAHLALAVTFFLLAFSVAGLVSAGANAPEYTCAVQSCDHGGVLCQNETAPDVLRSLNNFHGRCFKVMDIRKGSWFTKMYNQSYISVGLVEHYRDSNGTSKYNQQYFPRFSAVKVNTSLHQIYDDRCYLVIHPIYDPGSNVEMQAVVDGGGDLIYNSSNVICLVPSRDNSSSFDVDIAGYVEGGTVWSITYPGDAPVSGVEKYLSFNFSIDQIIQAGRHSDWCAEDSAGNFTFVTYPGRSYGTSWIYLAGDKDNNGIGPLWKSHYHSDYPFDKNLALHEPIFDPRNFVVFDELQYRCQNFTKDMARYAALCSYEPQLTAAGKAWYNAATRRRFYKDDVNGFAVKSDGSYVLKSKLAELGGDSKIIEDSSFTVQAQIAVYTVLSFGFAVNIGSLVWLYVHNRQRKIIPGCPNESPHESQIASRPK